MSGYRIDAEPSVDADIEAAFRWYEGVVVVAVLHTARDPAEWQRRLE